MSLRKRWPGGGQPLTWIALATVWFAVVGCTVEDEGREIGPSVLALRLPASMGALDRPAVEFDHTLHTRALAGEACSTCHPVDAEKRLTARFHRTTDGDDRDALMEIYHDRCIGCHQQREDAGPVTCGECHVRQAAPTSLRAPLDWDRSLHRRHVVAVAAKEEDSCQQCHHVYDKAKQLLEYREGEEEACRRCHGEVDDGDNPSLRHAVHDDCVNCHLRRRDQGADVGTGPLECEGCHDAARQQGFGVIADPPRLVRAEPGRQPDAVWISIDGATSNLVPFDHQAHEARADFCITCHHQTLKPCDECHTLAGTTDGEGVTLAQAYHDPTSERSCVGCHRRKSLEPDCAGCHEPRAEIGEAACLRCHSGPPAAGADPTTLPVTFPESPLQPLPEISPEGFPATVTVDSLAADYQPAELPHQKIVTALYQRVSDSPLATRFHATPLTLCAGCHHESPVATRPPPCGSCHAEAGDPRADKPGLRAAYHRQCIGCHQQMHIEPVGCLDCHAAADKEKSR